MPVAPRQYWLPSLFPSQQRIVFAMLAHAKIRQQRERSGDEQHALILVELGI